MRNDKRMLGRKLFRDNGISTLGDGISKILRLYKIKERWKKKVYYIS